jgi:glycosidase
LEGIGDMGVTHVWYTGILEHATTTGYPPYGIATDPQEVVKGRAGSPYAVRDYYDVDADLAEDVSRRMEEFEALIRRTHEAGMKVIIDFVPNHVACTYSSDVKPAGVEDFGEENYYMLAEGGRLAGSPEWYDTVKLRYTADTWEKMLQILRFWAGKGVDGFRCDMAEMVPLDFWGWVTEKMKEEYGVMFIGEVYRPELYRGFLYEGGFDYLYDKVGLYDTLRGIVRGELGVSALGGCLEELWDIRPRMLHFMENHDEVRIASAFFAGEGKAGIPGMIVAATVSTSPFMIYFGQEYGEAGMDEEGFSGLDGRTSIFDYWSMGIFREREAREGREELYGMYRRVCRIAMGEEVMKSGGYYRLEVKGGEKCYAYLRYKEGERILVVVNFGERETEVRVRIGKEAFEQSGMKENEVMEGFDLLTGEKELLGLTEVWGYEAKLEAYGGKVVKLRELVGGCGESLSLSYA